MKYCAHCGKQLVDEAAVCPGCGCPTDLFYGRSGNVSPNGTTSSGDHLSAISIVGFIFAFLQPLVGLICSIVAYKMAITDGSAKSKSFSKTGIVLSVVFIILYILLMVLLISLVGLSLINDEIPHYYYY